jgi:hypothetical protein
MTDMTTEDDKVEWYLQALEFRGDRTDYRAKTELHESTVLEEIYNEGPMDDGSDQEFTTQATVGVCPSVNLF